MNNVLCLLFCLRPNWRQCIRRDWKRSTLWANGFETQCGDITHLKSTWKQIQRNRTQWITAGNWKSKNLQMLENGNKNRRCWKHSACQVTFCGDTLPTFSIYYCHQKIRWIIAVSASDKTNETNYSKRQHQYRPPSENRITLQRNGRSAVAREWESTKRQ